MFDIFLMRKGIHIVKSKKQKVQCHSTNFNSIFDMSSYRKPEIQKDLPEITKVKLICYFFTKTMTKNPQLCSF